MLFRSSKRAAIGGVALAFVGTLAIAGPANATPPLYPRPCRSGETEHGTIGTVSQTTVAGWWYNCNGSGTDHVKIDVNNASDSPCYDIPRNTVGEAYYDPTFWVAFVNHSARWRTC